MRTIQLYTSSHVIAWYVQPPDLLHLEALSFSMSTDWLGLSNLSSSVKWPTSKAAETVIEVNLNYSLLSFSIPKSHY